jgi:LmbE family N-acetylglucosaminyl deacetylase
MRGGAGIVLPVGKAPFRLTEETIRPGFAVLVLAPHPDDFDEVGVTMRRLQRAGGTIRLAVLSSSANGVEDGFVDPPSEARKAAAREEEQRRSLAFFGLGPDRFSFERLPTDEGGYLTDEGAGRAAVRRLLTGEAFDIVVLPHGRDTNPDHRLVWAWWRAASALHPPAAWLFRDPKTIAMRLDLAAPFGEAEAAWKGELLRHHLSQQERNLHQRGFGLDERILRVNRDTARLAGLAEPYAEGFEAEG